MFGRLNDPPPQAAPRQRGRPRRGMGVPGMFIVPQTPVVYRATVVQSPPPDVSAGGTLIQNVPLLGPLRDVPTAPTVVRLGAQAGPGAAAAATPMGGLGFGGSPFGDAADRPTRGPFGPDDPTKPPQLMEAIPLSPLNDPRYTMRFGGFGGMPNRPARVYARRNYAGVFGAADGGGLKWWEIVFAPFTWISTAAQGVYEARGGEEGAVTRQKHQQGRKDTRVESRQERKTIRTQSTADKRQAAQDRKTMITAARAGKISTLAQAKATRQTSAVQTGSGTSFLDSAVDAVSQYLPDSELAQLTPEESAALAAAQQQQAAATTPASTPSLPLLIFGGAAIAGVAYLATSGKKKKKHGGE